MNEKEDIFGWPLTMNDMDTQPSYIAVHETLYYGASNFMYGFVFIQTTFGFEWASGFGKNQVFRFPIRGKSVHREIPFSCIK